MSDQPPARNVLGAREERFSFEDEGNNAMMESVEVDLNKHLKPKGFPDH